MTCPYYNHGICVHPLLESNRHVTESVCNNCILIGNKTPTCCHRGSSRKCCADLHICRKLKKDCIESAIRYNQYKAETKFPEVFEQKIICCELCEYNSTLSSQEVPHTPVYR
jgi:hypothetical protein